MKKQSILYFLAALLAFSACSDNSNEPDVPEVSSVYVINEGNFSESNGSLTAYNPETNVASQMAFQSANSRPLAGFIQTTTVIGDRLYILSNMSNKIEVVDLQTLTSVGTIEYSKTPVAMASAGGGQAYVTNLYDNSVTLVNLETMEATDQTIAVGSNPYFAYNADGKVFVSNNGFGGSNTISVIDVKSGSVTNTITVGAGPKQIVEDAGGQLWVVCEGAAAYDDDGNRDPENDVPGGIYIIDPSSATVVDSIENGGRPLRITLDKNDSRAYAIYAGGHVSAINMNTLQMSNADFINRSFNTIGFSSDEDLLYLGQSKGLSQAGQAIRYNLKGTAVDSFKVGISPIGFQFVNN